MRKRDYRAEYQRRLARAHEFGYSHAVARGHAPRNTAGIKLAAILGIQPGDSIIGRPPAPPSPPGTANFREKLEAAGFTDFLREQRALWLERETRLPPKRRRRASVSQQMFIIEALRSQHSEREAYTAWFSPK
jgi:hypothetical protein